MLDVEDWAEIRRLGRSEGVSISEIARVLGISRNTVRSALASDGPPRYQREPAGSVVDEVEPRIRELLKAFPTMPATVIAERVGWSHSIRTVAEQLFGSIESANLLLVGAAFQSGRLPIPAASIESAIELNGVAVEANTNAFRWGRAIVADPGSLPRKEALQQHTCGAQELRP